MAFEVEQQVPPGIDLFILTGPTAVGKTELALRWAERFGAEIVSCDSLLFYRGMDVGTAKPSLRERERVPHHLVDIADPDQPWSIHRYLAAAIEAVGDIHRRRKKILVTGGSGFYLKSFLAPVVDRIEVPEAVSRHVRALAEQGVEALAEELLETDPEAGRSLDLQNPRRVARALERCLATGRSVAELREEMGAQPFPFEESRRHICLLSREPDDLQDRIVRRVDTMLAEGLVEEVRRLLDEGLERNPSAASAIGYRETIRHLAGELPESQLREEIIRNTNRLVKKQRTWFRHQLPDAGVLSLTGRERVEPGELFEERRP